MKKLLIGLTLLASMSAFAEFDLQRFQERLNRNIIISHTLIMCSSSADELAGIYDGANNVAEMHGFEGSLPNKESLCSGAVLEALDAGISQAELTDAFEREASEEVVNPRGFDPERMRKRMQKRNKN